MADRPSAREAQRRQTRERLLTAALAEFRRSGLNGADIGAVTTSVGVAHGTFYFHFPTKEHVMLELERREEERLAQQLSRFLATERDLAAILVETATLVLGLERRLGDLLFKDFLALHFSRTRPPTEEDRDHPLIVRLAEQIEHAKDAGQTHPDVVPMNSAVFFLLGLYSLLITTNDWPTRRALLDDYLVKARRSIQPTDPVS